MITEIVAASDGIQYVADAANIYAQFENIDTQTPPGGERWSGLLGIVKWFCIIAGIGAIMIAGAKAGFEKYFSHGEVQAPKQIAAAVAGGVAVSTAGLIMQFAYEG